MKEVSKIKIIAVSIIMMSIIILGSFIYNSNAVEENNTVENITQTNTATNSTTENETATNTTNNQENTNNITTNSSSTSSNTNNNKTTQTATKKSSNANLSNLGIKPNDFSGFKPGTTTYNVEVPQDIEKVEVYAVAQDNKSKITGTGSKSLEEGKNVVQVVVTAEDGTEKTYTINITRLSKDDENSEEIVDESLGEGLKELKIKDIEISPQFKTNIFEYSAKYIGEKTSLEIETLATDETYKVEIVGNKELKEGENIITILVSKTNGENVATYQIEIEKSLVDEEAIAREQAEKARQKRIIGIGITLGVLVIGIIVFIIIKRRRDNQYVEEYSETSFYGMNDYDEEEYEEYEEVEELPKAFVKKERKPFIEKKDNNIEKKDEEKHTAKRFK